MLYINVLKRNSKPPRQVSLLVAFKVLPGIYFFYIHTLRFSPGNLVIVVSDMCVSSHIMREWINGITWKHVYCNISVLFIADTTVILKLMFRTGYCFFGHLGGCVAVINIFVALVTVAVFWVIFLLFQLIFVLFLFIFVVAVVIPSAASVVGTIVAFECVCVCVCVCVWVVFVVVIIMLMFPILFYYACHILL